LPTEDMPSGEEPTLDRVHEKLAELYRDFSSKKEQPVEEEEDRGRFYRGREETRELSNLLNKYHFKDTKPCWSRIYSWSWGSSATRTDSNVSSINVMKQGDKESPLLWVMNLRREVVRKALLRFLSPPKSDKFLVIELEMSGASVESIQWSGSTGGDRKPTESLSLSFESLLYSMAQINVMTGDILSHNKGFWNEITKEGAHNGSMRVLSLTALCKNVVSEYLQAFTRDDFARLPRPLLLSLGVSPATVHAVLPVRGRRLLVCVRQAEGREKEEEYKELFLKPLTQRELEKRVSEKLGRSPDDIAAVCVVEDSSTLVVIESDKQVKDLTENTKLKVRFV